MDKSFPSLLKQMVCDSQIKNTVLASYVKYDVSYISKWMNGQSVPARKNIKFIADKIALCIIENSSAERCEMLRKEFHISSAELLQSRFSDALLVAYEETVSEKSNASPDYELEEKTYNIVRSLYRDMYLTDSARDFCLVADIFAVGHQSRLLMAGIENGGFIFDCVDLERKCNMVISLNTSQDLVYDAIFLIHMMTSLSFINFQLFENDVAHGHIMYAQKDGILLTAELWDSESCVSLIRMNDANLSNQLYSRIMSKCHSELLIFKPVAVEEFLEGHSFVQMVLSGKVSWLTGHLTELLVPPGLFHELLDEIQGELNSDSAGELFYIATLMETFLNNAAISLMIYKSAFSKLLSSGELDFFNKKIILTNHQRLRCVQHIKMLMNYGNVTIKLVEGGFSCDFRDITDPCLFLSDEIGLIRLENNLYDRNLLLINTKHAKRFYECFFAEIWHNREDVVIADVGQNEDYLDRYIVQLERMSEES